MAKSKAVKKAAVKAPSGATKFVWAHAWPAPGGTESSRPETAETKRGVKRKTRGISISWLSIPFTRLGNGV